MVFVQFPWLEEWCPEQRLETGSLETRQEKSSAGYNVCGNETPMLVNSGSNGSCASVALLAPGLSSHFSLLSYSVK